MLIESFYFVGKYEEVGHDEKELGITKGRSYPVFLTFNKDQPEQKHTCAWFIHSQDAIDFAYCKNKENEYTHVN